MIIWNAIAKRLNRALTVVGALLLLAISGGITAEIVLRKTFNHSFGGMDELSSYAFAILTSFALTVAALARANIRIDVLRNIAPTGARAAMDLVAQLAMISFTGTLCWRAALLVATSWDKDTRAITPLATPVAWPQTIWLVGLFLFLAVLIVMFALSLRALFRGDQTSFNALLGPVGELDELDAHTQLADASKPTTSREP